MELILDIAYLTYSNITSLYSLPQPESAVRTISAGAGPPPFSLQHRPVLRRTRQPSGLNERPDVPELVR